MACIWCRVFQNAGLANTRLGCASAKSYQSVSIPWAGWWIATLPPTKMALHNVMLLRSRVWQGGWKDTHTWPGSLGAHPVSTFSLEGWYTRRAHTEPLQAGRQKVRSWEDGAGRKS